MFDVIHQWIRLNKLCKLIESFSQISDLIFDRKPKFFQWGVNIDQIAMRYICYISVEVYRMWDFQYSRIRTRMRILYFNIYGCRVRISYIL